MSSKKQLDIQHEYMVRGAREYAAFEHQDSDYSKNMLDYLVRKFLQARGWTAEAIKYWMEKTA